MGVMIKKKEAVRRFPVMALDVSTKTGVVVLGGKETSHFCTELDVSATKGENALMTRMERLRQMSLCVYDLIEEHKPELAVIEGYGYANPWSLVTLVEIGTVIRAAFFKHKVKMYEVGPNALKKFVLGKGAGKKDEVRLGVYKRWQFENKSDNIVDAYVLAKIGVCLSGQAEPQTKEQAEVIEAILHPKVKKSKKRDSEQLIATQ